jgi:hypothetical protein
MAIGDDFEIQVNADIRHTSGTSTYTVLELHRWLQSLADDASATGDDNMDITEPNPSDRATDDIITLLNGYNIDDDASEYFYGGSITQTNGDTVYSGLQVLGSVNLGTTELQVVQDGALITNFWGTGLNNVGTILNRILVKSRVSGADIDGKRIRVQAREYFDTFDSFDVTLGLGESVAAINTANDIQNDTTQATVTAYGDVTNTEGFQEIDLLNGNGLQEYYAQWTFGAQPDGLKALWEWAKDLTERTTAKTIHGINGELFRGITDSWAYDTGSGTFTEDEVIAWGTSFNFDGGVGIFTLDEYVSFGTSTAVGKLVYYSGAGATGNVVVAIEPSSGTVVDGEEMTGITSGATANVDGTPNDTAAVGGTGLLLAHDDNTGTGDHYVQLIIGIPPVDNLPLTGRSSDATALVQGTPSIRTVPKVFLGTYTGNLVGAYGAGVDPDDLSQSDSIEDLTGTTQAPPNNVTLTINVKDESAVAVEGATVRVEETGGTLISNGSTNVSGVYTDTYLYSSDQGVNVIVRLRKFLPFRATGTITTAGLTISVRFIKDTIVD